MQSSVASKPKTLTLPAHTAAPFALTMIGALLAVVALSIGTIILLDRPSLWRPFTAATVVGLLASAASTAPILWALNRTIHELIPAYMGSMVLRMVFVPAGLLVATRGGHYPAFPTAVFLMTFCFSVLVAECSFLICLMHRPGEAGKGE